MGLLSCLINVYYGIGISSHKTLIATYCARYFSSSEFYLLSFFKVYNRLCEVKNMPSILLHHIWAGLGRYFSYILYPISPKDFPNEFLDKHGRIDVNFFMYECFIYISS